MRPVCVWALALALGCGGAEPRPEARAPACDRGVEHGGCIADTLGQAGEPHGRRGATGCPEGTDCVLLSGAAPEAPSPAEAASPIPAPETIALEAIAPAASRRARPLVHEPGFERADALYVRAMSISLDVGAVETLQDMVDALTARVDDRARMIAEARSAYDDATHDAATRSRAAVRVADLLDAFASELREAPIHLPRDLERRLAQAPPEVGAEVRAQVEARTRAVLSQRAAQVSCLALERYRSALGEGVAAPRATEQIDAYDAPFAASCSAAPR